jgi:hypothetical protein
MAKSTREITKSLKRSRPPETGTPVMVRLQSSLLEQIDVWRRAETDLPSRAEALRRLAGVGLKRKAAKAD